MEEETKQETVETLETEETIDVKKEPKKKENKKDKEITKLQDENKELNDKVLRVTAEMQNMRRRYDEEIASIYKYNGIEFVKKILPVIDNFERAIIIDDNNLTDELSKFLSGFKMIYGNLKNILSEMGVTEINCLHEVFDPNKMEAVLIDVDKEYESNIVLDVMQKGYMYNDKVVRPAMVKVNE